MLYQCPRRLLLFEGYWAESEVLMCHVFASTRSWTFQSLKPVSFHQGWAKGKGTLSDGFHGLRKPAAAGPSPQTQMALEGCSSVLSTGSRWLLGEKRQHLPWLILHFWNVPPVLTVGIRHSGPSGELGCCGMDICRPLKGKNGEAGPGPMQGRFRVWTRCLRPLHTAQRRFLTPFIYARGAARGHPRSS